MVDKYGAGNDPACYQGTSVLKNLLNIEDEDLLEEAEREISSISASEIEFSPPPYDLTYLQVIHRTLFADIYTWAGEIRSVDISKGETRFCSVNRIIPEAEKLFSHLSACNYFAELLNRRQNRSS
jgi:cell filamentation protein